MSTGRSQVSQAPAAPAQVPGPRPKDRTHYLYVAVDRRGGARRPRRARRSRSFAVELKPLGTAFVALIKMMIQPVIFCTIVLGVGSVASAARVGKVGGLALAYFLTMSTVALAIGLVVGNLIKPGDGLHLDDAAASAGQEQAAAGHGSTTEFLLGIIPDLDALLADQRRGAADPAGGAARRVRPAADGGAPASRSCAVSSHLQRLVFRVLVDDHVGRPGRRLRRHGRRGRRDRRRRAQEPGRADGRLLHHLRAVRLRRPRHGPQARHGRQPAQAVQATWPASSC